MKYYINIIATNQSGEFFNAHSKARDDVEKTLSDVGYNEKIINWYSFQQGDNQFLRLYNRIIRPFKISKQAREYAKDMNGNDVVVFQYPDNSKCLKHAVAPFKSAGCRVSYIIHDLPSLRYDCSLSKKEIDLLNNADVLYVHTDNMKEYLDKYGISAGKKVITLFDYYTKDTSIDYDTALDNKEVVAFAGNLSKSVFLKKWIDGNHPMANIKIRLYGLLGDLKIAENSSFEYACAFKPDNISVIVSGWGLVWDGDSPESCVGNLGEYLRYNSSHKVSLYLTRGIPVICWKESALAKWIINNNVGIAIDKLNDIASAIESVDTDTYKKMLNSVRSIGEKLRHGEFMKDQML